MIMRAMLMSLCLFLCGCMLQSTEPLFSDAEGKPLLKSYGENFVTYTMVKGKWEKEKDQIKFAPADNHYIVHSEKSDIAVLFVPLNDKWWVMQASEQGQSSTYLLAQAQAKSVMFYFLACKDLKAMSGIEGAITFDKKDCTATSKMTKIKFLELTKHTGAGEMKIEATK